MALVSTARPDLSKPSDATPDPANPSFEERWAAWQARGAAHELAVRRRLTIIIPIVAVVAAVILALILSAR